MINKIILIGRVGQKPQTHQVGDGQVCNFSLATSKSWNDKNGQKQEQTVWHRIVVWGKQAATCGEFLDKGSMAYVEGSLEIREYTDRAGAQQRITEVRARDVKFLSAKRDAVPRAGNGPQVYQRPPMRPDSDNSITTGPVYGPVNPDDDIPF